MSGEACVQVPVRDPPEVRGDRPWHPPTGADLGHHQPQRHQVYRHHRHLRPAWEHGTPLPRPSLQGSEIKNDNNRGHYCCFQYTVFSAITGVVSALCLIVGAIQANVCLLVMMS